MATYYVEKVGTDRYDMRQERYRSQRTGGREHPHDLMATQFTAQGLREVIAKYFPNADIDTTALPPQE